MARLPFRPTALILTGVLLAAPAALAQSQKPAPATEEPAPKREPNRQMISVLPDAPDGWTAEEPQAAGGVLAMYTSLTAERIYRRGTVKVSVAAARSPTLVTAIRGSITNTSTLPPASRVGVIAKHRAVIIESKQPYRIAVQIPAGRTGLVMLTTDNGTLDDLNKLAAEVDYGTLTDR